MTFDYDHDYQGKMDVIKLLKNELPTLSHWALIGFQLEMQPPTDCH